VQDRRPRWSPDGRTIAFLSNRSGWVELHSVSLDGGPAIALTSAEAEAIEFAWSPAGDRLACVINRRGSGGLDLIDVSSGRAVVLRDAAGWHHRPQWGPGGAWLTVEFESPLLPPDLYRLDLAGETVGRETRLTDSRAPWLDSAGLVVPEVVEFPSSDGTRITGFLYRPTGAGPASRRPAIVYPHGGPADNWAFIWSLRLQWWVAKGYAVLAPDYRGSTGHGVAFQRALHGAWGTVDTQDVLAAADYLSGLDWIDASRLAVVGSSYGAYLAVLALARDPKHRFVCGVAEYGDSDIRRSWATGDRIGREDLERQMGHPSADPEGYRTGSPILDLSGVQAPLLISHGLEDRRVHPRQSEELVEELARLGKTFEYVVYSNEGHGLLNPANRRDYSRRLERFLDWYLI
jgi:dipeptidyl aminopeptidase/acylaminoacyl peptidase